VVPARCEAEELVVANARTSSIPPPIIQGGILPNPPPILGVACLLGDDLLPDRSN
jgi:hypothetical protein